MAFNMEEFRKNDVLKYLRIISLDIYKYRVVRWIVYIVFFIYATTTMIQAYFLLKLFSLTYLIRYSPIFFGSFYIIVCCAVCTVYVDLLDDTIERLDCKTLDDYSINIRQQVKQESVQIALFCVFNMVVGLYSGLEHMIPDDDDADIFFAYAYFEEYLPQWSGILTWIYRSTFLVLPVLMITPLYQFIYVTTYGRFQILYILDLYNDRITTKKPEDFESLQHFNTHIKESLVTLIKFHNNLLSSGRKSHGVIRNYIIVIAVIGGLLAISVIFFVIMFKGQMLDKIPRILPLVIAGCGTGGAALFAGQQIENVSEKSYYQAITDNEWYNWNRENKQIYLIILMNTVKSYQIKFSENVAINYQLGFSIAKAIYSALSVLLQLRDATF